MQSEPPKAVPAKRKRRWFQFSLRSLLIFTVICAVGSTWLGKRIERKRIERQVVDAIVKLGGGVHYDCGFDPSGRLIQDSEPPGPWWLRQLLGENFFGDVTDVRYGPTAEPRDLSRLTELRDLTFSG